MNAHAPIAERIAPLVPRLAPLIGKLGSPHDGEILAAARAIGRQLEPHGLGWNDLGRMLEAGPAAPVDADPERERWAEMADYCARRDALLTEKEADFIATMVRVLRRPRARPTPKQAAWLQGIFDRLAEGVA